MPLNTLNQGGILGLNNIGGLNLGGGGIPGGMSGPNFGAIAGGDNAGLHSLGDVFIKAMKAAGINLPGADNNQPTQPTNPATTPNVAAQQLKTDQPAQAAQQASGGNNVSQFLQALSNTFSSHIQSAGNNKSQAQLAAATSGGSQSTGTGSTSSTSSSSSSGGGVANVISDVAKAAAFIAALF